MMDELGCIQTILAVIAGNAFYDLIIDIIML